METLNGIPDKRPVWLMRQAGRYLPEYRALRETESSFLTLCYTPKKAAEITLQPIKRFSLDAAILFSDILVIPDALGQKVDFIKGKGPILEDFSSLLKTNFLEKSFILKRLDPVFETITRVRENLAPEKALIGFCGGPWTVACYMIAGESVKDQSPARVFAYEKRDVFQKLIDLLVEVSADYLIEKFKHGVDCVQIFESWAGVLPPEEFSKWCVDPLRRIVEKVRKNVSNAKIIGFPNGVSTPIPAYVQETGVDATGIGTNVDFSRLVDTLDNSFVTQGNIDPALLVAGGDLLDAASDKIRDKAKGRPHIFNLGHGVLPQTPVENVSRMIERLKRS